MTRRLRLTKFRDLSIDDPFFDSLKEAYREFADWFASKAAEDVYVVDDEEVLSGMLYLKSENGAVKDVTPPLPRRRWLKVGTLKVISRGTKLGERILKKIFDTALELNSEAIYVTVFDVHHELLRLFLRYGFNDVGVKVTDNGEERVLVRFLNEFAYDMILDYPFVRTAEKDYWLLAIYPHFHTRLLPDSILNNEPREIVKDVSHTNTIHKVYISSMPLIRMARGDVVIFYRTTDIVGRAYYRSVVTSVCVIEEVRRKKDFVDINEFLTYARPRSVYSEDELQDLYLTNDRLYVAKMTYNAALGRRTTRGRLLDEGIMSEQPRWDLRKLTHRQLSRILELGEVNARLVID